MARSTSSNSWEGVVKLAKAAGAKYPELVAAQWALESGWGKHAPGHNYFGLKGKGASHKTQEVVNGSTIDIVDEFLVFESLADCIDYLVGRWYLDFEQYKGVNRASSVETAARELQKQGYATNPRYAERLIELVRQHAGESNESKPQVKDEAPLCWIKARQDTWLKKRPEQATELGETERVKVPAGKLYGLQGRAEVAQDAHAQVELAGQAGTWFIWAPHWESVQKGVAPSGGAPGSVNWDDFGCQVTPSLTVGEVLQFDIRRIPASGSAVERRILQTAGQFQRIRDAWGHPVGVTSFYRPPAVNAEVGGVLGSKHVDGLAMDVYPVGRSLESFYQWIRVRWSGGLGDGRARGFIHLDTHDGTRGFVPGAGVRPIREWGY